MTTGMCSSSDKVKRDCNLMSPPLLCFHVKLQTSVLLVALGVGAQKQRVVFRLSASFEETRWKVRALTKYVSLTVQEEQPRNHVHVSLWKAPYLSFSIFLPRWYPYTFVLYTPVSRTNNIFFTWTIRPSGTFFSFEMPRLNYPYLQTLSERRPIRSSFQSSIAKF